MLEKELAISALMGSLRFAGGYAIAADQDQTCLQDRDQTKDQIQDRTRDRIYGQPADGQGRA